MQMLSRVNVGLSMRGLQKFISAIRECQTTDAEADRVRVELAAVRAEVGKPLGPQETKRAALKLAYVRMLGYEVDFGYQFCTQLMASSVYSEKATGYIASSLIAANVTEMVLLMQQLVQADLVSPDENVVSLALQFVANCSTREIGAAVFNNVKALANPARGMKAVIRRKAYCAMLHIIREDPGLMPSTVWAPRLAQAMSSERDVGCLMSLCALVTGLLEHRPGGWEMLVPCVIDVLALIMSGDVSPTSVYYKVPAPWLQVRLFRILQHFPPDLSPQYFRRVQDMVEKTIARQEEADAGTQAIQERAVPPRKKIQAEIERANHQTAEKFILFECFNVLLHYESLIDKRLRRRAATILGFLVGSKDANIRYVSLEIMTRMARDPDVVKPLKKHVSIISGQLQEADSSIRRQALSLLFAVAQPDNWREVTEDLMPVLKTCEPTLQEELVLKMAILVERNADDLGNYVDLIFRMMEFAPDCVSDEVWHRVVQVVTGFEIGDGNPDDSTASENLQCQAVRTAYSKISTKFCPECVIRLSGYLLGEFGYLITDEFSQAKQIGALSKHLHTAGLSSKAILLTAMAKIAQGNRALTEQVLDTLDEWTTCIDEDVQQRALELEKLLVKDKLGEETLGVMPAFSSQVRDRNPLERRLRSAKTQTRALERRDLEILARTAGELLPSTTDFVSSAHLAPNLVSAPEEKASTDSDGSAKREDHGEVPGVFSAESSSASSCMSDMEEPLMEPNPADVQSLWRTACLTPKDSDLYVSPALVIRMADTERSHNRLRCSIQFENVSGQQKTVREWPTVAAMPAAVVRIVSVQCQFDTQAIMAALKGQTAGVDVAAGSCHTVSLNMECRRVYSAPPLIIGEARVMYKGQVKSVPFQIMLPLPITKFMQPAAISEAMFRRKWDEVLLQYEAGSNQEHVVVGSAAIAGDTDSQEVQKTLRKWLFAFQWQVLQVGDRVCGAATFSTVETSGGTAVKQVLIPCLLRVDYNIQQNLVRLVVRTGSSQLSVVLAKIMASYVIKATTELVPSQFGSYTNTQQPYVDDGRFPQSPTSLAPSYPQTISSSAIAVAASPSYPLTSPQ